MGEGGYLRMQIFNRIADVKDVGIEKVSGRDIAIVGMSCKFPMAENIEQFWSNIKNGIDCVRELPETRKKDVREYMNFKNAGSQGMAFGEAAYLQDIDQFDYEFFGISPREAYLMDPNQRLFLETAWETIADAGYNEDKIKGSRVGVYVGFVGESEYKNIIAELQPTSLSVSVTGNCIPVIASRIAYLLDLKGPNMVVNTSCSSSLVAVHLACKAIIAGECDAAIAGGVQVYPIPLRKAAIGIEASDGRAKSFDDRSDGTGVGEGVGTVFLKPLSRALRDRDNIYAVIKGSAVNQDGSSIGISAPNPVAQEDVIVSAWKDAGINPETISYIETHGTGTKLGDPIEIDGIRRAFSRYTDKKQFCAVGSVKTNIGHLDSAAGIAGLIKAVLSIKNKKIPPSIHFERPNRNIDFTNSPVYFNDRLTQWEAQDGLRRCGVSSFGISGTNCHMILEEAPQRKPIPKTQREDMSHGILTISAKSEKTLIQMIKKYIEFFKIRQEEELFDICHTSNLINGKYKYRLAVVAGSIPEMIKKLETIVIEGLKSHECDMPSNLLYKGKDTRKVSLPSYPFDRKRCWVEALENDDYKAEELRELDAMELNRQGKDVTEFIAFEKRVTRIFKRILGYEEINLSDNFFTLGGDSIYALDIVNSINKEFEISMKVGEFLEKPTIKDLVQDIKQRLAEKEAVKITPVRLEKAPEKQYYLVSPAQKRMYILNQLNDQSSNYNIPSVMLIKGELDIEHMENAFIALIARHESLRTSFEILNGEIVQFIHPMKDIRFSIEISEIGELDIDSAVLRLIHSFELNKAPLFRANLIRIGKGDYLLMTDMHHIISDGASANILMKDLINLYENKPLKESLLQYKDFSEWQNKLLESDYMKRQEEYWISKFKGRATSTEIPMDFPRPKLQSFEGNTMYFKLEKKLSTCLQKLSSENETTLFIVLFTAYNILLYRYTGSPDIVVGVAVSGRTHADLNDTVGMFVNTLPILNSLEGEKTFGGFLGDVKKNTLEAYANQEYPFDMLVEKLGAYTDKSRNALFDTMFVMQNIKKEEMKLKTLDFFPYNLKESVCKLDIMINCFEHEGIINFGINYCINLFKPETIESFWRDYKTILRSIVENVDIRIGDIGLETTLLVPEFEPVDVQFKLP